MKKDQAALQIRMKTGIEDTLLPIENLGGF